MKPNRRAIAIFMVAVMVVGTAGVAFAAAPQVDTETSATSSTSEVNDGDTIQYNATTNSTLQYQADNNNNSVKILQNGTVLQQFDNGTHSEITLVAENGTNSDHLNFTISDDETGYTGIVADAGENVTLTYRLINDTEMSNPGTFNVTVHWDNHANKSFTRFDADQVETAELGTLPSISASIPFVGENISSGPAQAERTDVGVNGEDQEEITVHVADSDAQDALDVTHEKAGDNGISWMGTATVADTPVPLVASGEDGPDWLDTDEDAYVSVNDAGDEVIVHNGGEALSSDDENITVTVVGAEAAGLTYARALASDYGAGVFAQASTMLAAGVDWNRDPDFES